MGMISYRLISLGLIMGMSCFLPAVGQGVNSRVTITLPFSLGKGVDLNQARMGVNYGQMKLYFNPFKKWNLHAQLYSNRRLQLLKSLLGNNSSSGNGSLDGCNQLGFGLSLGLPSENRQTRQARKRCDWLGLPIRPQTTKSKAHPLIESENLR